MTLAEIRRYMTSWQREPAVVRLASVSRAAWRARQISIQRGAAHYGPCGRQRVRTR